MTTSVGNDAKPQTNNQRTAKFNFIRRIVRVTFTRELLIVLAFCLLTSIRTWPYVSHLEKCHCGTGWILTS